MMDVCARVHVVGVLWKAKVEAGEEGKPNPK